MIIQLLLLSVGFLILIKGADWLVAGATFLAKKYGVSDLAIGLTIVAFGTSAPELVVNIYASASGHDGIALGNVIGSNLFNLFFILGITGLIVPLKVQSSTVRKEIPMSLIATLLMLLLANNFFNGSAGEISRIDGFILLAGFAYFLYYVYRMQRETPDSGEGTEKPVSVKMYRIVLLIAAGLAGLVFGGNLILDNAVEIAHMIGISEKVIGLTIVAAGTSLPELATSIVAAIRKNNDIAVGNIVGSNIFNLLMILGLSSVIRPLSYDQLFNQDMILLFAGTILLFFAMFTGKRKSLDRWEAAIMLVVYIAYVVWLIQS
jgi:cation:H+ antiporter